MNRKPTSSIRPEAMTLHVIKTRLGITTRPRTKASKEVSVDKQLLTAQKLRQNKDGNDWEKTFAAVLLLFLGPIDRNFWFSQARNSARSRIF